MAALKLATEQAAVSPAALVSGDLREATENYQRQLIECLPGTAPQQLGECGA